MARILAKSVYPSSSRTPHDALLKMMSVVPEADGRLVRVAVVERPDMLGGVCLNTGTIPSKTLREAILYLTGVDQREIYGQSYRVKDEITIADLTARTTHVVTRENDVVRSQLTRNRVAIIPGTARRDSAFAAYGPCSISTPCARSAVRHRKAASTCSSPMATAP